VAGCKAWRAWKRLKSPDRKRLRSTPRQNSDIMCLSWTYSPHCQHASQLRTAWAYPYLPLIIYAAPKAGGGIMKNGIQVYTEKLMKWNWEGGHYNISILRVKVNWAFRTTLEIWLVNVKRSSKYTPTDGKASDCRAIAVGEGASEESNHVYAYQLRWAAPIN